VKFHDREDRDWRITFADTAIRRKPPTSAADKHYLGATRIMLTYGDGWRHRPDGAAQAPPAERENLHDHRGASARPLWRTDLEPCLKVTAFNENRRPGGYINGGFMVFSRRIFDYLSRPRPCWKQAR